MTIPSAGEAAEQLKILSTAGRNINYQPFRKELDGFL